MRACKRMPVNLLMGGSPRQDAEYDEREQMLEQLRQKKMERLKEEERKFREIFNNHVWGP